MLTSRDAIDRVHKFGPRAALLLEDCLALRRELVISASPLTGLFHPAARDEAALFQPVEQRIKRGDIELEHAIRSLFDLLADLVPVARTVLDQGQNEEFCAAFFQLTVEQFHSH